ncbi:MAG: hypothetical protein LBN36_04445, partial [Clostridiales Family XIII bacterium]|nr:hypothetical protein [Clostridiales Family XIII bacterium]
MDIKLNKSDKNLESAADDDALVVSEIVSTKRMRRDATGKMRVFDRTAVRVVAFALTVVLIAGAAALAFIGDLKFNSRTAEQNGGVYIVLEDLFTSRPFLNSRSFGSLANSDDRNLITLYKEYPSPEAIRTDPDKYGNYSGAVEGIYYALAERGTELISSVYSDLSMGGTTYTDNYNYHYNNGVWVVEDVQPVPTRTDSSTGYSSDGYDIHWGTVYFDIDKFLSDPALTDVRNVTGWAGDPGVEQTYQVKVAKDFGDPAVKEAFETLFAEELSQAKEAFIDERIGYRNLLLKELDNHGALYFIGDGETAITNVPLNADKYPKDLSRFTAAPTYLSWTGGEKNSYAESDTNENWVGPYDFSKDLLPKNVTMYLAYDAASIAVKAQALSESRAIARTYMGSAAIALLLALILFIGLIVCTGRKRADGSRRLYLLDNIFPEVQVVILLLTIPLTLYAAQVASNTLYRLGGDMEDFNFSFLIVAGIVGIVTALILWILLSLVRGIKSGLIVKRSLIRILICHPLKVLALVIKSGFDKTNPYAKTVLLVVLYTL